MSLDIEAIRKQFPILAREVHNNPLVYLDNAATTQKPQVVIDALVNYYSNTNSNVHRGAHFLSDEATRQFENARSTVQKFIGAARVEEIIWTSGTTEGINIVAKAMAEQLQAGDEVVVTELEHHANLVTWQQACKKSGATLKVASIEDSGELTLEAFKAQLSENTRFTSFPHISNALGTVNPVIDMVKAVRQVAPKALVLIDGAQGVAHGDVDVQAIGCDFYAFSGHKVFGPTGIGVLWGRYEVLENWPVWLTGGEMIATVTYQDATWGKLPNRLEAGTPNIAGAIGLAAALEWFSQFDSQAVKAYEAELMSYAVAKASEIEGLRLVGNSPNKIGVFSFVIEGVHPADIGFILDRQGVAIRTGDHCAQPLMARLGVPGTARASFTLYNTKQEIDVFFNALKKAQTMLM
ncbi:MULTISPECIES: aminotransferase class V-fold PLP-dependent enzyme [Gammaproteobacteria]|uniref:aminotransferase class V-fold PLP-dependent enzyme n=1 Tax=Gammaproteobacteria TaxID=1236 RepID=UPI000DD0C182|nr:MULTISPECIES: SufS family cysteine desulfurase [Gammaproteobacteria]RTE87088.1 SufS family cysteine desulfurase [Aliidiomarina sp. B3213]TCZ93123.1 SufS family cysteine desulfurase [Lysobacter sp. N42]